MSYIDLGNYPFVTKPDFSGFNTGNLTSTLDTQRFVNIPYFECYRILITTSGVNTSGPTVIQSAFNQAASLTALAVTLPNNVTVGNHLVAFARWDSVGTTPTQTAVTTGGNADHWGVVAGLTSAGTSGNNYVWINPSLTAVGKVINYTATGGTGGSFLAEGGVLEVANLLSTTVAANQVDAAKSTATAGPATTVSTASSLTTQKNDFCVAFGSSFNATVKSSMAFGGSIPTTTDLTGISFADPSGAFFDSNIGYATSGAIGSTVQTKANTTQAGDIYAGSLALFPSAVSSTPLAIPFTVAIDGKTWDTQTTTPGVGFTYNIGQSPLPLNDGNQIQLFWNLPTNQYQSVASAIQCQAWFRYDPSIQRR